MSKLVQPRAGALGSSIEKNTILNLKAIVKKKSARIKELQEGEE